VREKIPELAVDPCLFPQLGRRRRDGAFPGAGGQLSTTAVIKIVRPIMLAAGILPQQAHPHTLRHTFGRLYMAAPGGVELSRLQRIMGFASPEATSRYVHHSDLELGVEHRRIERLRHDPLDRRRTWHGRTARADARYPTPCRPGNNSEAGSRIASRPSARVGVTSPKVGRQLRQLGQAA
jgi:hypothetical protein